MASGIISTLAFLSLLGLNQAAGPNCEGLTKPLDLKDDYSSIMGKWIFTEGIANHELFKNMLKIVNSSWLEFAPSSLKDTIIFKQGNKRYGICFLENINATVKNSTFFASDKHSASEGTFLPSCPECLTISFTHQARNESINSLFLLTKSPKVSESEKDLYWKQAVCLGFKKEPQFSYDGVTELCKDDQISSPTEQTKPEDKKED
ncbi:saxitoxin and tetrodotoxin-binding protein 2 isoform X2 [Astyanax mexicanus]|uniref:saxitoxin and tetrodotoxin-binding protein 2 isoform X2 n=1 Tax=Astyanax mexicanus TaxID=7994 RepID=UPI0020CB0B55|nr:saxitoxin and tetrodotoxin-binding protein 2 isoform X2 [Astyanax mexicanus]